MLSVFGKKPENSIYLGDQPYAIRNDCSLGQWKVGDSNLKGKEIQISIIKVARYFGIFAASFEKHSNEYGVYYSVQWDWKERTTEAETKQLELIESFMQTQPALIDLSNTQNLIALDGLSSVEVQRLLESRNLQYLQAG